MICVFLGNLDWNEGKHNDCVFLLKQEWDCRLLWKHFTSWPHAGLRRHHWGNKRSRCWSCAKLRWRGRDITRRRAPQNPEKFRTHWAPPLPLAVFSLLEKETSRRGRLNRAARLKTRSNNRRKRTEGSCCLTFLKDCKIFHKYFILAVIIKSNTPDSRQIIIYDIKNIIYLLEM